MFSFLKGHWNCCNDSWDNNIEIKMIRKKMRFNQNNLLIPRASKGLGDVY